MTKLNTGLSGCSLELINDRVLRKYSPTTDYNSRLLSQADKQVVFGNRIYKNIDAPKVYDIQENYFDMEYIAGKNLRYLSVPIKTTARLSSFIKQSSHHSKGLLYCGTDMQNQTTS